MENKLWKNISCKYILKRLFSFLKVTKALKIIKSSEKIKARLDISLFHYQYCSFFVLFKKEKIERIEDILESSYLKIFPDDKKYELILKFIEAKKLFSNEYLYLNIDDKNIISLLIKLNEKQNNKSFNYIIGNIEEKIINKDIERDYHNNITNIIQLNKNNVEKILFDYNFFFDILNIPKNINYLNVKHLFINITNSGALYNISLFENLEYLSIKSSIKSRIEKKIKVILSEIQYKKIKTLKIIEPNKEFNEIQDLIFETSNADSKYFENLKELYTEEELINQIKLNPRNLQKLNILFNFRNINYSLDYIQNSIIHIFQEYSSLNNLNIFLNDIKRFYKRIINLIKFFFDSLADIENLSLNFLDGAGYRSEKLIHFIIEKNKNQKLKFIIKRKDVNNNPYIIFESHFDKIEKFEFGNFFNYNNYACYIENNNSILSLNLIKIKKNKGLSALPINVLSSLKLLHINSNNLSNNFPLFSYDSSIKFLNLEYLSIYSEEINKINAVINNFINIPNLRFLSIYHTYFNDSGFSYHRLIISKCELLKKLNVLIIGDFNNAVLMKAFEYYSIYPELKNTNIRLCSFSKTLRKQHKFIKSTVLDALKDFI